jgi:hypothetical protein
MLNPRKAVKRCGVAAVAALALAPPLLATAADATPAPKASTNWAQIMNVKISNNDPSVGYVRARYSCNSDINHLWVSIKQNESATDDKRLLTDGSGFGHIATTWVQSHPSADLHCDGTSHVQTFRVNTKEKVPPEFGGGTVGYGALKPGMGYVQFCLTGPNAFAADMSFHDVSFR